MSLSVSIVIPTYNRADLIGRALSSAVCQIRPGDEILVIDDGSTDGTEDIVRTFGPEVQLIRKKRIGAGRARNAGVEAARGDLVAFLDSDDEWMPGKVSLQRAYLERNPAALFCFSNFAITTRDRTVRRNFLVNWHHDPRPWDEILGRGILYSEVADLPAETADFKVHVGNLYAAEMAANYIFTSTLMVRRIEAGDSLHFGEELPTYEDWECFGRLARKGPAAYFDIETAWQHSHTGPRLTDASLEVSAWTRLQVLERVWGADAQFLETHGKWYRSVCQEQHLIRVKAFLAQGLMAKAKVEMKTLLEVPTAIRVLSSLPSPLVRTAIGLRRLLSAGR